MTDEAHLPVEKFESRLDHARGRTIIQVQGALRDGDLQRAAHIHGSLAALNAVTDELEYYREHGEFRERTDPGMGFENFGAEYGDVREALLEQETDDEADDEFAGVGVQ